MSNIEAPLLDSFFSNQGLGTSLNYCAICLRTEKQRRMVSNSSLVTFTNIIVMNKAWQHRSICYVCEVQAQQATRFIVGVSFGATLDTIFKEILIQKHVLNKDVFQNEIFRSVLEKFSLAGSKLLPKQWEETLRDIRYATRETAATPQVVTQPVDHITPKRVPSQIVAPHANPIIPKVIPPNSQFARITSPDDPITPPVNPITSPVDPITPPIDPPTPRVDPFTPLVDPFTPLVDPFTPPVTDSGRWKGKGKGKGKGRGGMASQHEPSTSVPTDRPPRDTNSTEPSLSDSELMRPPDPGTRSIASRAPPPTYQNKDPDPATLETRKRGRTADMFTSRLSRLMRHADIFGSGTEQTRPRSFYHKRNTNQTGSRDGKDAATNTAADKPNMNDTVEDVSHNGQVNQPGVSGTSENRSQTGLGGDSEPDGEPNTETSSARQDEGNQDALVLPPSGLDSETIDEGKETDADLDMEQVVPQCVKKPYNPQTTDWEDVIPARVLYSMNAVTPRPDPALTPVTPPVLRTFPPAQKKRRPSAALSPADAGMLAAVSMPTAQTPRATCATASTAPARNTPPDAQVPATKVAEDPSPGRVVTPNTLQMRPQAQNAVTPRPDPALTPVTPPVLRTFPPAQKKRRSSAALVAEDPSPGRVVTPNTFHMMRPQAQNAVTPRPDPALTPVTPPVLRTFPPAQKKRRPSAALSPADAGTCMLAAVSMPTAQTPRATCATASTAPARNTPPDAQVPATKSDVEMKEQPDTAQHSKPVCRAGQPTGSAIQLHRTPDRTGQPTGPDIQPDRTADRTAQPTGRYQEL